MDDAASLDDEFQNSLYQAWVEQVSLMRLVKMRWKEKKSHSLFSSAVAWMAWDGFSIACRKRT
jgi:hypothetical protein